MKRVYLKVMAVEYIPWFPGFLRCELLDRHGKKHEFVEKIPVICGSDANYDEASLYPIEITFDGQLVNENSFEWVTISTKEPYDISSEEGLTEFEVSIENVIRSS